MLFSIFLLLHSLQHTGSRLTIRNDVGMLERSNHDATVKIEKASRENVTYATFCRRVQRMLRRPTDWILSIITV